MKQKIINLFIVTGILWCNAFAQPVIKGQRVIGGTDYDELRSLCVTKDGGLIAGGSSYSNKSYEKSQNIRGLNDYWIVKMDSQGKIQWDKTIGGNANDNFKSVIQTNDGGYALIGESNSNISVEKSENSWGNTTDYWLVKLDSAGNIEWDKTIGGSGTEYIDNIVQTSDSGYILAGSSDSYISGYKTEDSRGYFDYWVVKLNKRGNKVWDKTIGGNDYEFCSPVELTSDGGVIIGGFSQSNISGEKTENSRGEYDYWVVKLDQDGKIQWDKTTGGDYGDFGRGIKQTDDGGYALAGNSYSNKSGEKTEESRGGSDYWVVKLDSKGNKVWDKTIGGSAEDQEVWCLEKTSDDGFIFGGASNSNISGEKTEDSRGDFDYWVVKLDKKGNIQWDKTIGGTGYDAMFTVKEVGKNKYAAGGVSYSAIGADKTVFSRGSGDYWIVKLLYTKPFADAGAISVENVYSSSIQKNISDKIFTVYPNPAKDVLNVQVNGKTTITLTNQSGKIILAKAIDASGVINVANLPAGLYYLKNNATGETQKVIID